MLYFDTEMPKKINEKSKKVVGKNVDFTDRSNEGENIDNEYTTAVDSEMNKKYSKRVIQSNWSKYDELLLNFESGDENVEIPKTDDFRHLLKTASSDCSHFQFNSEKKLWKSEEKFLPPSSIFNLDLNILSSGLACVPFYERIGLDENYLTVGDKQRLDAAAAKSLEDYNLLREKLFKESEDETKVKNSENVKTLDESFSDKLNLNINSDGDEKKTDGSESSELDSIVTSTEKVETLKSESNAKKGENKSKIYFSETDENLEDWLDSVLDD